MTAKGTIMASKSELTRIHTRIDEMQAMFLEQNGEINKNINSLTVSVTKIATVVENWPHPQPRPCDFFNGHILDHKDYMVDNNKEHKEIKESVNWCKNCIYIGIGGLAVLQAAWVVITFLWKIHNG